jgi:hypothetical protein
MDGYNQGVSMKKTTRSILAAAALLLASCGGATVESADTSEATTATTAATTTETTSAETTTTTMAPATSTTAAKAATTTTAATGTVGTRAFDVLLQRVDAAGEPTSARVEGSMEIVGLSSAEGDLGNVTVPFSMAYDSVTGNSSFSMDLGAMAAAMPGGDEEMAGFEDLLGAIEVREIGDTSYINFGFFTQMMGAETAWVSMPKEEGSGFGEDMAGFQTDPNSVLEEYRDANAEVEEVGRETVNGVETTHYSITVDTADLLAELSKEERAELEASGPIPNGILPIDMWISDDDHIVRMIMEIDGTMVEETDPTETFTSMTFTFDVFDIGQPIAIEAPPASEVTPADELFGGFDFDLEG